MCKFYTPASFLTRHEKPQLSRRNKSINNAGSQNNTSRQIAMSSSFRNGVYVADLEKVNKVGGAYCPSDSDNVPSRKTMMVQITPATRYTANPT